MNARRILILLIVAASAVPTQAGIIFNRKPKPNANERVVQLISAIRTETDDHKRAAAAEELRGFDAAKFPEIVPVLLDCALHDKASGVRAEAVHGLGKLRPISQQVGYALEQIVANDSSVRVQVQARSALLSYRVSGYRSQKSGEPPTLPGPLKTEEPPLVEPAAKIPAASPVSPEPPKPFELQKQRPALLPGLAGQSLEPPLAPATPGTTTKPPNPLATGNNDGPVLNSPK
jgi:hypothetical protein